MLEYYPEGRTLPTAENQYYLKSPSHISEACAEKIILEARALVCDSGHNLIVDLGCMKGKIPREEGAIGIKEGTVRDIAVISRVNRPVCFTVTGFEEDENGERIALLSRREAQCMCMEQYINTLRCGDVINARITHLENFGAFADIGCGVVALMPIDTISVSRIEHPGERFTVGMDIKAIIKSIDNGRISLTHKELLGTWEENANKFKAGETVAGIIRSVEDYGAFVELTPNLAGLAEAKEGIKAGQQASVFIKNIIPQRMKIKLIIIDTFEYSYKPSHPEYFFTGSHMDRFLYSPLDADKVTETVFG
ncbi:MAG: S1 RNA-binding domain-containing protein [Acutalibacteraceae bacterium]